MITTRVREMAERRGIENAFQLANRLGVSPDVGARLWSDNFTRIDFVTLNRLCNVLKCQPAQLIKFTPDVE